MAIQCGILGFEANCLTNVARFKTNFEGISSMQMWMQMEAMSLSG